MQPNDYQNKAASTAIFPRDVALPYLALGCANEAGELAGAVKKYLRGDYSQVEMIKRLTGELGDVLWYLSVLAKEFDIKLEDVMVANIEKLMARLSENKIKGDGDFR